MARKNSKSAFVKFERVQKSYDGETLVVKDLNLEIPKGEFLTMLGPSGSGKSTVFELLQRFYDPQTGKVCIYGIDVKDLSLTELRSVIGLVPQDPTLFSSNVWHNIRYGDPSASDDQVQRAARQAHIHDFIQSLPDQYDSSLGERGVRLSGGQKQRDAYISTP